MYSPNGAQASAVIYSLVETEKANDIRIYDYFEYLIQGLSKRRREAVKLKEHDPFYVPKRDYIQDMLPWSKNIKKMFSSPKKNS